MLFINNNEYNIDIFVNNKNQGLNTLDSQDPIRFPAG